MNGRITCGCDSCFPVVPAQNAQVNGLDRVFGPTGAQPVVQLNHAALARAWTMASVGDPWQPVSDDAIDRFRVERRTIEHIGVLGRMPRKFSGAICSPGSSVVQYSGKRTLGE